MTVTRPYKQDWQQGNVDATRRPRVQNIGLSPGVSAGVTASHGWSVGVVGPP